MDSLELRLYNAPQLILALRCPMCRHLIDGKEIDRAAVNARLFGAKPYAICLNCGQEMEPPWDRRYKVAYNRELRRRKCNPVVQRKEQSL